MEKTFSNMGNNLGCPSMVQHVIHIHSEPIKALFYFSCAKKQVIKEMNKILVNEFVQSLNSPWKLQVLC